MLIRVGSRGSRLALTQAELAAVASARAGHRDRARPDHDRRRPRPHEAVRRDRRPRRVRQGARGGAARAPDRRRRALGEGHDLDRPGGSRRSARTSSATTRATRCAARPRSAPGMRIGTASARRKAQLLALEPTLSIEPLRGNIDTRLRKRGERGLDAIVLAACGLDRLGLARRDRPALRPGRAAARGGAGRARAAGSRRRGASRRGGRPRGDAPPCRGGARASSQRSAAAASRPLRRTTTARR